ncbi:MAG: cation:proton antiporter [Bacteroidetes bacterium]|nr:cation:proton antiporter [Bacteroidota bacterium]
MTDIHAFLNAITIVLCVAAVTTVLFQRLRQPVVLGYVLAGVIVGPHVPIPLVADQAIVTTLSELGVILLMFSLGLEFSLRKLAQIGSTAGIIGVIQSSILVWTGYTLGQLFGWTTIESLFLGAIIAISSTTIIAKVFDEQRITGKHREIVVGVLIVEDLIGILFMAVFTGIASGSGLSAGPLMMTIGKLTFFLAGVIVLGLFFVPPMMRSINALKRKETTLVASIGFCFAIALLAQQFGYSVALGAFLAGSLIAESGEEKEVEHLVEPVRDMFAAVFFVSVGMLIDPGVIVQYLPEIAVITLAVIVVKFLGVAAGTFLTGAGMRTSVKAGMSMAQIGEFSFIIAGLGLSLNATGNFLYPITVAVSAITTLTTPLLIRASGPAANWLDRKLPKPLQTFATLYGSWIEEVRLRFENRKSAGPVQRLLRRMLLDGAVLGAIVIGTSIGMESIVRVISGVIDLSGTMIRAGVIITAAALAFPFCFGIIRVGKKLGLYFARMALPAKQEGRVDLDAAPRRMLVVTLQLGSILLVGLPLLAVSQPFVPSVPAIAVVVPILVILAVVFWRNATDLQGHVRAGAEVVAAALNSHAHGSRPPKSGEERLSEVHQMLPGLGDLVSAQLSGSDPCVGKTLAQLNLRGVTGATVLAIMRKDGGVVAPKATEQLQEGDVLALSGTHEAVESAKQYLRSANEQPE